MTGFQGCLQLGGQKQTEQEGGWPRPRIFMGEEQIIQFLQNNINYMVSNDIVLWIFRTVGWGLAKLLSMLIGVGKNLYDFTFGLVDVTSWSGVDNWIDEFRPLIIAIMTASLVVLGFMYMFGKNKKHNIAASILTFAVVATSSTFLFSTFNEWTVAFKDAVVTGDGVADGPALINSNLYDLVYIDGQIGLKNMSDGNRPQYASLSKEEVDYIKITDVMDWDDVKDADTKDILKKKLAFRTGTSELEDVSNGLAWTSIGNDLYFRYKFNFGTFYLDALAVILIYFCLAYKNVRIAYELLVGRVLLTLKAGDLSTSKKTVKILECLKDQYFALCFTAITIRTYFILTDFIKQMVEQQGQSGILRGIITVFVAFCVIDGSNIMQKITGVDAGLSTFTGKLLAMTHLVQGMTGAANQHRMLHAMKQKGGAGSTGKSAADNMQGRNGESGGRNAGEAMDKDLNTGGKQGNGSDTGKMPGNGKMPGSQEKTDQAMSGKNATGKAGQAGADSDAGRGNADGKNGQKPGMDESAANARQMAQGAEGDAGTAGRNPMAEDVAGNAAEATKQMEQMDQELGKSGEPLRQGQMDKDGTKGQTKGQTKSHANPEGSMFDKWGRKQDRPADAKERKNPSVAKKQTDRAGFEKNAAGNVLGRCPETPMENGAGNSARKAPGPDGSRKPADAGGLEKGGSRERSGQTSGMHAEQKAQIRTSGERTASITEERLGRDRYVGGEAISRKPQKEKGRKKGD